MIITINQPKIFPRLHLLNRILSSDVNIWLINAQVEKKTQARVFLSNGNTEEAFFSVPVHGNRSRIVDTKLAIDNRWRRKFLLTIERMYKRYPYFEEVFSGVRSIIEKEYENLAEMAIASFDLIFSLCGKGKPKCYIDNEILEPIQGNPSVWMAELVRGAGGSIYLTGSYGVDRYVKWEDFSKRGVSIITQAWEPPLSVNLSWIHAAFEVGPENVLFNVVK